MQIQTIIKNIGVFIVAVSAVLSTMVGFAEDHTQLKQSQHISLPSGPGSLEGLGSTFEPQLNTGGANYSVPIAVPNARGGFTPELALQYNSSQGQDVIGLGWSLNIPYVERSLEYGQPQYNSQDIIVHEKQRLLALSNGDWAPQVQTQFLRFRISGKGWEAWDKAGNYYRYGLQSASRIGPDVNDSQKTYRWYLEQRTSAVGHTIYYDYQKFSDSPGVLYLSQVRYNESVSGEFNTITFHYETRPDVFFKAQAGFPQETTYRINEISVAHGSQDLWSYELSYDLDDSEILFPEKNNSALKTGVGLLQKVTRWNAGRTVSLPPMRFEYTQQYEEDHDFSPFNNFPGPEDVDRNGNGSIDRHVVEDIVNIPLGLNLQNNEGAWVDLNADGLSDWLTWKSGSGYAWSQNLGEAGMAASQALTSSDTSGIPSSPLSSDTIHLVDLDGDGLSDLLQCASSSNWRYYRNQGNGSFAPSVRYPNAGRYNPGDEGVTFSDINFDQRLDIVKSDSNGWRYCLNGPSVPSNQSHAYDHDLPPLGNFPGPEDFDSNNNGRIDLPAWECSGTLSASTTGLPGTVRLSSDRVRFADMNGDRLDDAVVFRIQGNRVEIGYYPQRGMLSFGEFIEIDNDPEFSVLNVNDLRLLDLNGDGLADLYYVTADTLRVVYQFAERRWSDVYALSAPGFNRGRTQLYSADINGNGSQDIIWLENSGSGVKQFVDLAGQSKANLLTTIDNGMGLRTTLSYQSSGWLQAKATDQGEPWLYHSPLSQQVVTSRAFDVAVDATGDGINDRIVENYRYRDAYYDPYRKQFRGFAFARVENINGPADKRPVVRHYFHTGAPDSVDNDGDGRIDERGVDGSSEELALVGKPWKIESTDASQLLKDTDDATQTQLYQRQATTWLVRTVHDGDSSVSTRLDGVVSFAAPEIENTYFYELSSSLQHQQRIHDYDDWGNVIKTTDFGLLTNNYDNKVIDTEYAVDTRGYFHLPSTITTSNSNGTIYSRENRYYDDLELGQLSAGLVTRQSQWVEDDEWLNLHETDYDHYGNPIAVIDGEGDRVELDWDEEWSTYPITERRYPNNQLVLSLSAKYDTGLGVMTDYMGFNQATIHLTYDHFGRLLTQQKPLEAEPGIEYRYVFVDPFRRTAWEFSKDRQVQFSNSIDKTSYVHTRALRDDGDTEDQYQHSDGLGRELASIIKDGSDYIVQNSQWFDLQGRVVKQFRPWLNNAGSRFVLPNVDLAATDITHDAMGRPLTQLAPQNALGVRSLTSFEYEPRFVRIFDPKGYQTEQTLYAPSDSDDPDFVFQTRRQQEINGSLTWLRHYTIYDGLGRLRYVIDPNNNRKTQYFDGLSRKTRQSDPNTGETHYFYNGRGQVSQKTDNLGRHLYFHYDGAGRIEQILDTNSNPLYQYHYDEPENDEGFASNHYLGHLAWFQENHGNGDQSFEHYHYDANGNVRVKQREINGIDYRFDFAYNRQDRLIRKQWPDGDGVDYGYTPRGYVKSISSFIDEAVYELDGQIKSINYANGTTQTRFFDDKGQLDNLVSQSSHSSDNLLELSYRYDINGNITTLSNSINRQASQSFTYDPMNQLIVATGLYGQMDYEYDAIGNLNVKHSSDNSSEHHLGSLGYGGVAGVASRIGKGSEPGPNAVTSATLNGQTQQWLYDAVGQRLENSHGHHYDWDQQGRLIGWQKRDATDAVLAQETYQYDVKGRRLVKLSERFGSDSGTNTVTYVDKDYEIRDALSQKHIFLGNIRVGRIDTPIAQTLAQLADQHSEINLADEAELSSSDLYFLHNNHLGSVAVATDASGEVVTRSRYRPYGAALEEGDSKKAEPYGFSGKEQDESGLYYFEARYYDPVTARFISPDPLFGEQAEQCAQDLAQCNLYQYAVNNPVAYVDSTGMYAEIPAEAISLGLGATSFVNNLSEGRYLSAGVDAVGVGIDLFLAFLPGPPGIAGASIQATRNGGSVVDVITAGLKGCCCFEEGTLVSTENGYKAIELIEPGDVVYSKNLVTGELELKQVTKTFITEGKELYELVTQDQYGNYETVKVTDNHPYWVAGESDWIDSAQLKPGMVLIDKSGNDVEVVGLVSLGVVETTYNFEVEGNHNYFVGELEVLVHNCTSCLTGGLRGAPELGGFAKGISAKEIESINKSIGNSAGAYRDVSTALFNASQRSGFYNKAASLIRDIAGGHMFKDGNKRTAQMVVQTLMERNGITGGPNADQLRGIVNRVADSTRKDHLSSIDQISSALKGY